MKRLKIEAIERKSSKLLSNLNMEKGFEMEEIKEIEYIILCLTKSLKIDELKQII